MKLDIEKYRKHVDHLDLSEEAKLEVMHVVWWFMESFLNRELGNDPVQHCLQIQNKNDRQDSMRVLESKDINETKHKDDTSSR